MSARTYAEQRRVMEKVLAVWAKFPDLRLCQLITNARCIEGNASNADPFYTEDQKLVLDLEGYARQHSL